MVLPIIHVRDDLVLVTSGYETGEKEVNQSYILEREKY